MRKSLVAHASGCVLADLLQLVAEMAEGLQCVLLDLMTYEAQVRIRVTAKPSQVRIFRLSYPNEDARSLYLGGVCSGQDRKYMRKSLVAHASGCVLADLLQKPGTGQTVAPPGQTVLAPQVLHWASWGSKE
jgi:hypothetical protein